MIIQHNMSALNAHRNLSINNKFTSGNLEKLSSGYRINRAADDAAGLAISEKMRGQIRGLAMAEMNVEHGINLIQTAEGGLQETHAILQRMRELAVQSANGTYEDENDRFNLNKELEALKLEIDRIAESTHYNGINLLDGNLSSIYTVDDKSLLDVYNMFKGVNVSANYAEETTTYSSALRIDTTQQFQGDKMEIDISLPVGKLMAVVNSTQEVIKLHIGNYTFDINYDGVAAGIGNNALAYSMFETELQNQLPDYSVKVDTNGKLTITHLLHESDDFLSNVNWASDSLVIEVPAPNAHAGSTVALTSNNYSAFKPWKYEIYVDGSGTPVDLDINGNFSIDYLNGLVVTLNKQEFQNKVLNDILVGYKNDPDTFTQGTIMTTIAFTLNKPDGLTFQIGANGTADQHATLFVENMGTKHIGLWERDDTDGYRYVLENGLDVDDSIAAISVAEQTLANEAIKVIDAAINYVSATRADLGAMQNRLEHALSSLGVTKENLTAAESTIRDVDMAKEMMEYTKNSILVQASQAMLAQAQSLPQGVLNLLQ